MKNAIVLGASPNPERYSFLAVSRLTRAGYLVFAVGKKRGNIGEIEIKNEWPTVENPTIISLYLNPANQEYYYDQILSSKPGKVIFNPGAENPDLAHQLDLAKIPWEEACTLVLLSTGAL
jgi:uncharacterized protein